MPKFTCSYGFDVSFFTDFIVEAADEKEAKAIIEKAHKDGVFDNVETTVFWENTSNHRVFVQDQTDDDDETDETLAEIMERMNPQPLK